MRVRSRYVLRTKYGILTFDPNELGMERDEEGVSRAEAWMRKQAEKAFGMSAADVDETEVVSCGEPF